MPTPIDLRNLVLSGHPLGRLIALHRLRVETDAAFEDLELAVVHVCRKMPPGTRPTFDQIGAALDVTKSNAKRRYDAWLKSDPLDLDLEPTWEDPIYEGDLAALAEFEAEGQLPSVWLDRLRKQVFDEHIERYEAEG